MTDSFIRQAKVTDVSRIAEILVFSKRTHYRGIFQDDAFSFGELQVYAIAQNLQLRSKLLSQYAVYDDGFVKGLIQLKKDEIAELYVDPFFEGQGIGSALMEHALNKIINPQLWVLDGNDEAVSFYEKHGFSFHGEKKFVPGTDKTESKMTYLGKMHGNLGGKIARVIVDRPIGSTHPDHPDIVYPVNYGYIEGIPGGDGEDQDAYVFGVDEPVRETVGKIVAVIHREDDNEDKWVVVPEGKRARTSEIQTKTAFQERFFRTSITLL